MHKKLLFIFSIFIFLTGCAVKRGHQFLEDINHEKISRHLIKNKTSKDDVRKKFGDPENVNLAVDGGESWFYHYTRTESKGVNFIPVVDWFYSGANHNTRQLKIKFNRFGLVEHFAFSNSQSETRTGLLQ
ncbi:hypothetical protein P618_200608 [Holospora obtusa F1]|uniref:SmpA / OmlA family protein n=1 Tax=Holospora obtusa F1 TaxID=1399147 RepID=W6TEJ7_HOLOB|nr:hypothetical protein [Holospora obtusa]ETZ07214.1 hypothetical protein P618_200608 [Holospora obtusa F1]